MNIFKVITRQMKISAFKGANYYVIEVIAFVLNHIKSKFEEELEMGNHRIQQASENIEPRLLKAFDFTWVITVPAIWNEKGKQMMREAAYRVSYFMHMHAYHLNHPLHHRLGCSLR